MALAFKGFLHRQKPYFVLTSLLLGMGFVVFFNQIVTTIKPGELGVLWRRLADGTVLDRTYHEGLHLIMPYNKMYHYNVRNQKVNDTLPVLTIDGLTVEVIYSIRYFLKSESLPLLHTKVGPNYAEVVVKPEVRSAIRTIFGQYKPEEIYRSQSSIQEQINGLARERFEALYVGLDAVPIHTIILPKMISTAIEEKLATQEQERTYVYRTSIAHKEAARLKIEAEGLKTYNHIVAGSLDPELLRWYGVKATESLSKSNNSKVIVIGSGENGLPIILGR
jgi:regulator of protease activity HflC (stomatin/prohibitin superfamily)